MGHIKWPLNRLKRRIREGHNYVDVDHTVNEFPPPAANHGPEAVLQQNANASIFGPLLETPTNQHHEHMGAANDQNIFEHVQETLPLNMQTSSQQLSSNTTNRRPETVRPIDAPPQNPKKKII